MNKLKQIIDVIYNIYKTPKRQIKFSGYTDKNKENYQEVYRYFTKPHRLILFKNKTLGVALIDLNLYENFDEYYKEINGKNSAAYYARKAIKREYKFQEIDRNHFVDDMYNINISAEIRQGRTMSSNYLNKVNIYIDEDNYRYFGVIDVDGKLVSYCNIGFYGEFALLNKLMGHKKYLNDGIMFLMMIELNRLMFNEYKKRGCVFIMYDTYYGASNGLKAFKDKLSYRPYNVKWKI